MSSDELKVAMCKIFPNKTFNDDRVFKLLSLDKHFPIAVADALNMLGRISEKSEIWREELYLLDYLQKIRRKIVIFEYNNLCM